MREASASRATTTHNLVPNKIAVFDHAESRMHSEVASDPRISWILATTSLFRFEGTIDGWAAFSFAAARAPTM